jgi:hypothetical protein
MNAIVSLEKMVKKKAVVVLLVDSLHHVEFEQGRPSTPTEQRCISQVLRAMAHAGELTAVAGYHLPRCAGP